MKVLSTLREAAEKPEEKAENGRRRPCRNQLGLTFVCFFLGAPRARSTSNLAVPPASLHGCRHLTPGHALVCQLQR